MNFRKSKSYKAVAALLFVMTLHAGLPRVGAESVGETNLDVPETVQSGAKELWELPWYAEYLESKTVAAGKSTVKLTAAEIFEHSEDTVITAKGEIKTTDSGFVEYKFQVPADGSYHFRLTYLTGEGSGLNYTRRIFIDGAAPFREAYELQFRRIWQDDPSEKKKFDRYGNQFTPAQTEVGGTVADFAYDNSGIYDEPLCFRLTKGEHKLRIVSVSEAMTILAAELVSPQTAESYEKVSAGYGGTGAEKPIFMEAEDVAYKSDPTIYAGCDRSSAAMSPYAIDKVLLNYLSGERFSTAGQWVTYGFQVKETGYYKLSVKFRQTQNDGGFCTRQIFIDDRLPFAEAADWRFLYSNRWDSATFSNEDDEPYLFYLTAGRHTLTFRNVMGETSKAVGDIQTIIAEMNDIYRKMYMIIGPKVDSFRDYNFKKLLAEELVTLKECSVKMQEIMDSLKSISGIKSGFTTPIERMLITVKMIVNDPESTGERMSEYKSNLGALADWCVSQQNQKVDTDFIEFLPQNAEPADPGAGIFKSLIHNVRLFISSFITSYSTIGMPEMTGDTEEPIKVWLISGGRDQATLIKQQISTGFSPEYKVPVLLQLVSNSLMTATLAGIGPDVALFAAAGDPVNYAVRGAVQDLSGYDGFDKVVSRFFPESLTSMTYKGNVYALPETIQYPMLFYRTDIFSEMGLSAPKTWGEAFDVISTLSSNQSLFAVGTDINTYLMFLYQEGGRLFDEKQEKVLINNYIGITAFEKWTHFFTDYSLPIEYNFVNRFRTGEIAAGIADFTTANQLKVFAPEIRGLWDVLPVPATVTAGGENRSVVLTGTANMMMSGSDKKENAWRFLDWWSSEEIQTTYAKQLESVMGIAARYPTANLNAFDKQAWTAAELKNLKIQRESAKGVPEIPGSYIIPRYITFAFRGVVNKSAESGEQILYYSKLINNELKRKLAEFEDAQE